MTLKNKFLTTLLALLVGLSAIFGLALSSPAVTKADEPTIDTSTWEAGEVYKNGDVIGGKLIRLKGNASMWFALNIDYNLYFYDYGATSGASVTFQSNYTDIEGVNASDYVTVYSVTQDKDNCHYLDVYFHNDIIKDSEGNEYFDLSTQGIINTNDWSATYVVIPEGYVAGENGIELASDEEKEDNDFLAGITDWINNAGETVSNWLGENTGIAISSSSVLFVGAIVIIILASSKRKK